jgi:hypothetical protein
MGPRRGSIRALLFLAETMLERILEVPMEQDEYFMLKKRYLLLQIKYLRLKEVVEKFLKKRSGYKELRDHLKLE